MPTCVAEPATSTAVGMGEIALAHAPGKLASVLGSCIGVVLYHPRLRIDLDRCLRNDGHAIGSDFVITELLRLDAAQARNHLVAERTGREGPVRLDQRHLQFGTDPSQGARAGGAAKAAADHDDACGGLGAGRTRESKRCGRRRDATNDVSPRHQAQRVHEHYPEKYAAAVKAAASGFRQR